MHSPLGGEQLGQGSEHPSAPTSPSSSISPTAQRASLVKWDERLPVRRPLARALELLPRATRTVLVREAARDIGTGSCRAHASASDSTWRFHLVDLLASTKAPRRSGAGPTATWCRPSVPAPRVGTRGVSRPSAWRGARVIVRDLHRAGAPMEPVCRRLLGSGVTVWSARARTARSSAASSAAPKPVRRRGGMTYMRLISPMPGAMVRNLAPATGWSPSSPMRETPSGGRRSAISIGTPGSAPDIPESSATISANRLRAGSVQRHRHKRRCAGRASPSEATARRPNARRARSGDTRQVARCSSSNQTDLPARSESTPQAADRHSTSCRPLPAVSLGPVSRSSGRR